MRSVKELWRRLRYLGRLSRFNAELDSEISFHIDCRAAELIEEGFAPDEARARARREFGSSRRAVEETREAWQVRWLEELVSDVRYAARAFCRNPGFALTAVVCLALGIGANTTMFSITTNLLFSQPSCRDAGSLVDIWEGGNSESPVADLRFVRDAHILEDVAGTNVEREMNWRDGNRTRRLFAALVTDNYFGMVGAPFRLGRGIAPGETNTAVLAERIWRSRFDSDPAILGHKLVLDGRVYTIVGILPADNCSLLGFGFSTDVYTPVLHDDDRVGFYARMPHGMTRAMARERLRSVFEQLDRIRPKEGGWKRARDIRVTGVSGLETLGQEMMGPVLAFFAMLMILVGLVLLIACTNVASLLLARASSRSQELAVRLSLGASRARIIRHLLAESLLLAVLGAVAGLLLNFICARAISNITLPLPVPIHISISPDARLLAYSVVVALGSAIVSGLLPAFKAVRRDVNAVLKAEERQTGGRWGLRGVLVAGQLSVTVVLLAAGFLFLHNLLRAATMNPGFDIEHTVWTYMRLVPERYSDKDQTRQMLLVRTALERLRALPGVEAAAVTGRVPLNDNCVIGTTLHTDLNGHTVGVEYECNDVGPDYFRAIGIPLLAGREFTAADRAGSERIAIVNESFARRLFGDVNPVGHTVKADDGTPTMIVGLVKDSKYFTLGEKQRLALYKPYFANEEPVNVNFLLRVSGPPESYVRTVTGVLGALDSTAAIETKPMSRALGIALLPSRAGAAMLGAMGVLGLALASIGLYGVLLYSVSRRTREIGLRVALGATPRQVLRMVCRDGLLLVGSGLGVGLALALVAMRPMAMFLVPGVTPADPATFLAVLGVLGAVAALATIAPALRALRVDPMSALRYE